MADKPKLDLELDKMFSSIRKETLFNIRAKGGRGIKADYPTKVIRVPAVLIPLIRVMINCLDQSFFDKPE